jgi:amino acid transporter
MRDEGPPREPEMPSLEKREWHAGRKPGDRSVRIVRPGAKMFRRADGQWIATESVLESTSTAGRIWSRVRRALVGRPLEIGAEEGQRVSPLTGLAVLAPSNVSSSAYATEEMMRALALGGLAAVALAPQIAIAVIAVLALIVLSESRVIRAYPNGGGSYLVARTDLGIVPGLVAGAALLVDYILTVAVSAAAGVIAISSVLPQLADQRVPIGIGLVALVAVTHIRGVREAGLLFAGPTYAYIGAMLALIGVGAFRVLSGDVVTAAVPHDRAGTEAVEALGVLLVVRAFAAGAVALTGSEAVANVVPAFKAPQARNATVTLVLMTGTLAVLFLGLTFLAVRIGIVPDPAEIESVNSMLARSIFGDGSLGHLFVQLATAAFLLVAANTGFSGFPRLAAVLANDRFMPRHFADMGSRLSHSFGIIALALMAGVIIAIFDGSVSALVPLYTVAVFLSFTLSQAGMLRRTIRAREGARPLWIALHALGAAIMAGLVLAIAVTRIAEAWIAIVLMPLLVALLYSVRRHYRDVEDALTITSPAAAIPRLQPPVVIVPVGRIDRSAVQAVAFARSISDTVKAVHISTSRESGAAFGRRWQQLAPDIPIDLIDSPYRALIGPLLKYIDAIDKSDDRPITVVIAEFVPRHWWEWLLHSQTATRLKAALLFRPNTIVIDVPYHFEDTADLARRR